MEKLTLEKLIERYNTSGASQVFVYPHEVIGWVFREMNGTSLDELIADAKSRPPMSPEEIKEQRENFTHGQAMPETSTFNHDLVCNNHFAEYGQDGCSCKSRDDREKSDE